MSHVPEAITDAAFAAHMALADNLRVSLGREPTRAEAAQALAEGYGDMFAGSGAEVHQIDAINRMAQRGPVAVLCCPKCSFKPPFVRKRQGFSSPMLNGGVADCRSR